MMDVRQLRVLLAIRDAGSLTRAAGTLHLSVPTVAHHLDALEATLSARLMTRSKRGASLTPIGEAVATDAERILAELERTEQMVADLRDAGLTTVRIGTFPSVGSRLLPHAIRELQRDFRVRVEVVEGEPSTLIELLRSREIHAALVYDLASDPALISTDLQATELLEEAFVVMLGGSHPLAERARLDTADLVEELWVMSHHDDEASNRVLRQMCLAAGHEARAVLHTDDLNMIHGFVDAGLGLALMTESAIDRQYDVVTRPCAQPLGTRRTSLVTRAHAAPVVTRLGELLRQIVAERS